MPNRMFSRAALAALVLIAACSPDGSPTPVAPPCDPPDLVRCGPTCVDLETDEANCGACGNPCGAGWTCSPTGCLPPPAQCLPPNTECGELCTNLAVDEANCGACGNPCDPGELCVQGVCGPVCAPPSPARCGAVCVDLQSDEANCGSCGHICAPSLRCLGGTCTSLCTAFETTCPGDTCATVGADDANCGACGNVCAAGTVCSMGACVASCSEKLGLPGVPTVAAGQRPVAVASGDLDGDGHVDLVFANETGQDVTVVRGLGGGRFAAPVSYALGGTARDLVVADLSGDGTLDVAATVSNGAAIHHVAVLLNGVSGSFAAPVLYDVGSQDYAETTGLAAADLNGDGALDLAAANRNANEIAVLLNQGGGTFPAAPARYAAGSSPEWVAVGDLTGDGKPDLAVSASSDVLVFTNQGAGTFATPPARYPPVGAGLYVYPDGIALGDLDGDGRKDIALAEHDMTSAVATVLWNAASNPFATRTVARFPGTSTYKVALADVDADGALDVVSSLFEDKSVGVARNTGARTFAAARVFGVGGYAAAATVSDLDGDGVRDLAAACGDHAAILRGNGDGTFVAPLRQWLAARQDVARARLADVDGDGAPDLVTATWQAMTVGVARGNGDGTFGTFVTYPTETYVHAVEPGDLDGDGWLDLVVVNGADTETWQGSGVSVYMNLGDGTFAPRVLYGVSNNPDSLALGDVNEDGNLDAVVARGSWQLVILLGNGDGTLQAPVAISVPYYTWASLSVADMDGDGRLDIVAGALESGGDCLLVFRNKGGATLAERFTNSLARKIAVPRYADYLSLADVNADGKPDVIGAEADQGYGVYRNLGDLSFAGRVANGATWGAAFAVADMDGDRFPDIVKGGTTGAAVLRGRGDGTFEPAVEYPGAPPSQYPSWRASPITGDVNGDGRPDVVMFWGNTTYDTEVYVLPSSCR